MPRRHSWRILTAASIIALTSAACSPIIHTHGYTPRGEELANVAVGHDTRETVQRKLGRPSTVGSFGDSDWYYISIRSEQLAFYEAEIVEQQVVTISFSDEGLVEDVGRYGLEDGQVVDLVTRETPTSGRKLTLLQQIFHNVGRFGSKDLLGGPGGTGERLPTP